MFKTDIPLYNKQWCTNSSHKPRPPVYGCSVKIEKKQEHE